MYDADARDKCIWCVSSGSSVSREAKAGNKCSGARQLLFSDIHSFSEESCLADQWEKPSENLVVLHQMLFASVNHTLSASVCAVSLVTLVRAVTFPGPFVTVCLTAR